VNQAVANGPGGELQRDATFKMARLAVLPVCLLALLVAVGQAANTTQAKGITTQTFGPTSGAVTATAAAAAAAAGNASAGNGTAAPAPLSCQGFDGAKSETVTSVKECQAHCKRYGEASPDKEGPLCHCGEKYACTYEYTAPKATTTRAPDISLAPVLNCNNNLDDIKDGCPCRTRRNIYGSNVDQPEFCESDCCDGGKCASSDECTTEQVIGIIMSVICICCCCVGGMTLLYFAMGGNNQQQAVYRESYHDSYAGNGAGFEREVSYSDASPQYNDVVATQAPPAYSAGPAGGAPAYTAQAAAI